MLRFHGQWGALNPFLSPLPVQMGWQLIPHQWSISKPASSNTPSNSHTNTASGKYVLTFSRSRMLDLFNRRLSNVVHPEYLDPKPDEGRTEEEAFQIHFIRSFVRWRDRRVRDRPRWKLSSECMLYVHMSCYTCICHAIRAYVMLYKCICHAIRAYVMLYVHMSCYIRAYVMLYTCICHAIYVHMSCYIYIYVHMSCYTCICHAIRAYVMLYVHMSCYTNGICHAIKICYMSNAHTNTTSYVIFKLSESIAWRLHPDVSMKLL